MLKKGILFGVCLSFVIGCFGQTKYCSKYDGELILNKTYLTISYNKENKIPNYVAYYVLPSNLSGDAQREPNFYTDTTVPKAYRSYTTNYTNSGYDRGHMSPAADWKYNADAMHESFAMSNICPQAPTLNQVYWKGIENLERYYAKVCDTLYVVTGSIVGNSTTYIKNKVRVPERFFKACMGVKNHKVVISIAWVFENTNDKQSQDTKQMTINAVEKVIGKDLFQGMWFNEKWESRRKVVQ